jgi:hypothetical protein
MIAMGVSDDAGSIGGDLNLPWWIVCEVLIVVVARLQTPRREVEKLSQGEVCAEIIILCTTPNKSASPFNHITYHVCHCRCITGCSPISQGRFLDGSEIIDPMYSNSRQMCHTRRNSIYQHTTDDNHHITI